MSKDNSVSVKSTVHKIQTFLLEGIKNEGQLFAAGSLMSCGDYQDVVIERSLAKICGYPLCSNSLPSDAPQKGRYHISLKEHKVYDLNETYMYCSSSCIVSSRAFGKSLPEERCSVRNLAELNDILGRFDNSRLDSEDLGEKNDLGSSKLKIQEKMETGSGEVSLEEWIGASNAIEGYVPQRDRHSKTSPSKTYQEGSTSISAKQANKTASFFNDMDFSSIIITNDEYSITKDPSGSTNTTSNIALQEKKGAESRGVRSFSPSKHDSIKTSRKPKARKSKEVVKVELSGQDLSSPLSNAEAEESEVKAEAAADLSEAKLKPTLKASGTKKLNRSVTWADDKVNNSGGGDLCEVREMEDIEEHPDAIGKSGVILVEYPPDLDRGDSMGNVNSDENGSASHKWRLKKMPEPDVFDHEDSWFDAPPEEFSLMLSPFATMWMALFAWVTSSSLAYIYGRDESSHEDYLSVNGREYPRKVVLQDGRSSQIKLTVEGCLGRAFPGLVAELGLRVPVSSLEQGVACLLETMSFVDAVPAFRMKQWQLIAFLFVEALSVSRIPALTSYMNTRRLVLNQVVDGARISAEEYEVMKDLIMPLGRLPQAMSGA
ncbi:putative RNA polymerase II subunit B1 CTD phosphatase RPAP2 homolog [Euphorbia lathyris]|uniref:putative RNA polymerase II subunit B1 CTD phosphatase RPAP2 homolog n=1 Tax=Euphorbia lathyris TaxID=212925 RepID=UPI003314242B